MASRRKPSNTFTFTLPRLPLWVFAGVILLGISGSGGLLYAAHMEENDAFCASCHSEPETAYFQRSTAAAPTDLASWHHSQSTRCIDCHSGGGVTGRIQGMSVGAGDLFMYVTGQARQPAPLTVPIGDGNCLKCHQNVTQTNDFNRHFHAFLSRWQAVDSKAAHCVDCHSSHTTDGNPSLTYLQQQRAVNVCQRCHNASGQGG